MTYPTGLDLDGALVSDEIKEDRVRLSFDPKIKAMAKQLIADGYTPVWGSWEFQQGATREYKRLGGRYQPITIGAYASAVHIAHDRIMGEREHGKR